MTFHRLGLIHPFDPRDVSPDPIDLRLRAMIASEPIDFSLLVVGVDLRGDLELGVVTPIAVADRRIDFIPVARRTGGGAFALGLLQHLVAVRAAARAEYASTSAHAFAWAPFARIVGRPVVLVVHRDPRAGTPEGGASKVVALKEWIALHAADRIVACEPGYVRRCREASPAFAAKTELLPLPVNFDPAAPERVAEDLQIIRLWERHRRLFDAHEIHRGFHAAA